ncbi:hypothetical protein [Neobacillus drentensis]|uniref:hypothetical protein n=1 Tax=Neobacillus drentensis TaxID=220684 RepID=UPI003000EF52
MQLIKRKESSGSNHVKMVAYTIILFISSLFVPFIAVATYQSVVYFSRAQWFFSTPFSAYITFMSGMIYLAVILTLYLIFRQRFEGSLFKVIFIVLLLSSIPAFVLSLTNYYYLDKEGIHYNNLMGFDEKEYRWDKMARVHIIYRNHQGTTGFYKYRFEMKDGSDIMIPYNEKLAEHKWRVEEKIKENNIQVSDNFNNPIVD